MSRSPSPASKSSAAAADAAPGAVGGSWLVTGLLSLGVAAAVGGIWFQRQQTRRCLEFYGPVAARRIAAAPRVELLAVRPGRGPHSLAVVSRLDVSRAAGMVHLRRGLVEDDNFIWRTPAPAGPANAEVGDAGGDRRPPSAWDAAFVFRDPADGGETAVVVDVDGNEAALAVVGQPGTIGLGRIAAGLKTWIRDVGERAVGSGVVGPETPAATGNEP